MEGGSVEGDYRMLGFVEVIRFVEVPYEQQEARTMTLPEVKSALVPSNLLVALLKRL